jgi:hypothetical protein
MTIKTITQDTPDSTLPSMIISSQVGHSYYPVTASPVRQASSPDCAGREIGLPGYDGRMTTNSSTSRPAPADARVTAASTDTPCPCGGRAHRLGADYPYACQHGGHLAPVRTRRVAALLAACPADDAL